MNIQENISLKEYTTFDIGGPAQYFVAVQNVDELTEALSFAQEQKLPYFILAGGSNTLFSDDGFAGVVIKMAFTEVAFDGTRVSCGAGVMLLDFLWALAEQELTGLAKLAGVPGTIGGALRGNAEAFHTAISDCVESIEVFNTTTQQVEIISAEKCNFSYRQSVFKSREEYIILGATFALQSGSKDAITQEMHETIAARNAKQIQDIKSAGSFFMNPEVPTDMQEKFEQDKGVPSRDGRVPAGWLLESVGIKDKAIGGVTTGSMHANYFINTGAGTAADAMTLASLAKTRVRNKYGIQLKEEITLAGF